jgi:Cytochrome c3
MNMTSGSKPEFGGAAALVTLVLGVLLLAGTGSLAAQYQGAESCYDCHDQQYYQWLTSGHRFILMRAEDARHRQLTLPDGLTWDDVRFVVGGNKTKALFLDPEGYLYTPASGANQYNLLTGDWSDYHAGETKVYDCGNCHTTGYQTGGFPPNLPGISGTFALPGVQCEHCHGPGNTMAAGDTDAAFCGECHNHGPSNAIAAGAGFIRSEGQYNEFLAGPHAALSKGCVSCHDPHQSAKFGISTPCSQCHSSEANAYAGTLMAKVGVACEDCHMPPATLSAQPLGPHEGDMKTHIFYIDTDPAANMFTQNGGNVVLSGGKAAVTLDFACQRCHQGASLEELARFARDFHDPNKSLADFGLDAGLTGTWWNAARSGEGFVLQFGYAPGTTNLTLFASFYTYDNMGNQAWLVALPSSINGTTVNVNVYITGGRMWGNDFDPADGATTLWGTGTFTFPSCTSGSVSLAPNANAQALGYSNLSYQLTREDFLGTATACPGFANNTQ